MTTVTERPDPYRLRPSGKSASRYSRKSESELLSPRQETFRAGLRSMLHEHLEDAAAALESLATPEALAAGDPMAIDALAYLSSVRWGMGRAEDAIDVAERALRLGPDRFAPNQKAGEMSLRLGNIDTAEARFLAALRASEPGTADAKAAERCLLETRRRAAKGIRHEANGPRLTKWLQRLAPARLRPVPAQISAGPDTTRLR